MDYKSLYPYAISRLQEGKTAYVFLGEIQMVPDFQKTVDSLYIQKNVDLYITSSNAWLLSGELATLLSGRYVEINLLPFSFDEYCCARYDLGYSLENVVYFELLWRGYRVNVGKLGQREIDFVAEKNTRTVYVQATATMTGAAVFEREMAPLQAIRDNYPKIVLTLDRFTVGNYEGIEVINAVDWLMEQHD